MDRELLEAACQGSRERVNELVRQGADVNSGMYGAAKGGYKDLVDLFIKKGATDWDWGMVCAAKGGHKELVDLFIKKGANHWNLGMCSAAKGGHKELVDLFIKNGANEWNYGMLGAVQGGYKELVDLFVKKGANEWNGGLLWSKTISLTIFFIDHGADNIIYFPLFYKDICVKFHLPNGVLINKLLRRYIARFRGNKLRNEKVIINGIYESTLDQVFISLPGTIVKFRNETHVIKGHIFYLLKSRNPQFK